MLSPPAAHESCDADCNDAEETCSDSNANQTLLHYLVIDSNLERLRLMEVRLDLHPVLVLYVRAGQAMSFCMQFPVKVLNCALLPSKMGCPTELAS